MKNKNMPYVICHMLQSIDGKISGNFFRSPLTKSLSSVYSQISQEYNTDALVYGSVTAYEIFMRDQQVDYHAFSHQPIDRNDVIFVSEKKKWLVVIDPEGKLVWDIQSLTHERLKDRNVIQVLSDKVSDQYLNYLKMVGVSYIFAGHDTLSMKLVLEKLRDRCHVKKVILQGGGIVNEAFANEDLIDELSFIISPVIDGESHVPSSFESGNLLHPVTGLPAFELKNTQILQHSGLWLNYVKKNT